MNALSIIQIALVILGGSAAVLFGTLIFGFRLWKKAVTVPSASGFGYHYKSKKHEQVWDASAQWAQKYLNPVALIWIGAVSLGVWMIIRVVLSFTL